MLRVDVGELMNFYEFNQYFNFSVFRLELLTNFEEARIRLESIFSTICL